MPVIDSNGLLSSVLAVSFLKAVIILFLSLYAIFALIVVRQVNLMSKTLITSISPVVTAFAIIHAGIAVGLVCLAFGLL